MDNNILVGAPQHFGIAPTIKKFLFLFTFLFLLNSSVNAFSFETIKTFVEATNLENKITDEKIQEIAEESVNYDIESIFGNNGNLYIAFADSKTTYYNTPPEYATGNNSMYVAFVKMYNIYTGGILEYQNDQGRRFSNPNSYTYYYFKNGVVYTTNTTSYYLEPESEKPQGIVPRYKKPYFEFAKEPIGTSELTGIGKTNMYYMSTLQNYVNDIGTYKTIGYLYIDKNYNLANIFFPSMILTKQAFNSNQKWNYRIYEMLKDEVVGDYMRYYINIDINILNSPYIYNLFIESVNNDLAENININFGIVNNSNNNNSGIIIESGDEILSGDFTKDETTLGDIQNTISGLLQPFNPDESELNKLTSGDILGNMGYSPVEDENADLWDTLINGLKETLTGEGEQTFIFSIRDLNFEISSNNLYVPDGDLKTFLSIFVNFWMLMQMFQFIKRTIDQINEGNLKVMHDVSADCYFF